VENGRRWKRGTRTGEKCRQVLYPIEAAMNAVGAAADVLSGLLYPITQLAKFIAKIIREIDRLVSIFLGGALGCALELIKPITNVVNLTTCPIGELAGLALHASSDLLFGLLRGIIEKATNHVVRQGINAIVPDNLDINIPNFKEHLPTELWVGACSGLSVRYPQHASAIQELNKIQLPQRITGQDIRHLISNRLERFDVPLPKYSYVSACAEAFKEMMREPSFQSCRRWLGRRLEGPMLPPLQLEGPLEENQMVPPRLEGPLEENQKHVMWLEGHSKDNHNKMQGAREKMMSRPFSELRKWSEIRKEVSQALALLEKVDVNPEQRIVLESLQRESLQSNSGQTLMTSNHTSAEIYREDVAAQHA